MTLLAFLVAPVAASLAAIAAYLIGLSVAAVAARPAPPPSRRSRRFALLVPAHDEAAVIERLVASLRALTYPMDAYDVLVVADNCSDATATLARAAGAMVHERRDLALRGKGHALRWLLDRVRAAGAYDAYIVFDADSVVAPDFLSRMDARLAAGSVVIQSHYAVLNADAAPAAALRAAALASLHYLRPLGRSALGLSCGLKGNGMCFEAKTLDRVGWNSVGLAEDVEMHLALIRNGIRVDFAPEAIVRAEMPESFAAARSQNMRWEAGRLAAIRHEVIPLLRHGIARRDMVVIDAAIEQLIPPLSLAVTAAGASAAAGLVAGSPLVAGLGLFALCGLVMHVVAGLIATSAPRTTYLALARAPLYVVWKATLYVRALAAPAGQPWLRTKRRTDTTMRRG
jgi:cellulose synthase/poly-beta-1,6-N-acetylglucosamine synthase-like glycosyltransferase